MQAMMQVQGVDINMLTLWIVSIYTQQQGWFSHAWSVFKKKKINIWGFYFFIFIFLKNTADLETWARSCSHVIPKSDIIHYSRLSSHGNYAVARSE